MLHLDPFTAEDFRRLDEARAEHCVSIYLPTNTVSRDTGQDKILFKGLFREAISQLENAGVDKRHIAKLDAQLEGRFDDLVFWNHLAEGLAVFITPDTIELFRLPRAVSQAVEVSDRFHIKPLIPFLAFPHTAYVLEISQNQVRLWEVTESDMLVVEVPDMPGNFNEAMERRTGQPTADSESVRMRQEEDKKVRQRQFTKAIHEAVEPIMRGQTVPLVLAGVDTMLIYYREADTYAHTTQETISGNQEHRRRDEFAAQARSIVARRFDAEIRTRLNRVETLRGDRRSSTDIGEITRAAREGRIESLVVDVERELYGRLDGELQAALPEAAASATTYDVLDELVGLTIRSGGEVIGLRKHELPDGVNVAAIFRYAA
jgi:hypothetical protein